MARRCSQCKRTLPESEFLNISRYSKRPGWKVTFCNDCARSNMTAYSRGVVTDPNKIKPRDE